MKAMLGDFEPKDIREGLRVQFIFGSCYKAKVIERVTGSDNFWYIVFDHQPERMVPYHAAILVKCVLRPDNEE